MDSLEFLNLSHNPLQRIPLSLGQRQKTLQYLGISREFLTPEFIPLVNDYFLASALVPEDDEQRTRQDEFDQERMKKGFQIRRKTPSRARLHDQSRMFLYQLLGTLRDAHDLNVNRRRLPTTPEILFQIEPCPPSSREESTAKLGKRQSVIKEIIATEATYVHQLKVLLDIYLYPLRFNGILSERQQNCLFSNIEDIYAFHQR
jgi:hypothetical protein